MKTAENVPLYRDLLPRVAEVEDFLRGSLESGPESVRQAAAYMAGAGGKRIRTGVMLAVARLLVIDPERVILLAAAVEVMGRAHVGTPGAL